MESAYLPTARDDAQKMTQENVEIVRRAYEAFNRGDIDGALADLASDFEYTPSGAIPGVTKTALAMRCALSASRPKQLLRQPGDFEGLLHL